MNKTIFAHAAALAAALLAGSAVVATRFVVSEIDPVSLVFYRYLIAVVCFVPILPMLWPRHGLAPSEFAKIAVFGILFFLLFPWAFNASLQYIPAGRGAVGLATVPIQTMLVAVCFKREQFTLRKCSGVLIAFVGVVVALGSAAIEGISSNYFIGDALMLLGVFCAALYSVFARPTLMRHGPIFVTALAMAFAVVASLPVVLLHQSGSLLPALSMKGWLTVLFLGTVAGAVQFSLFMLALRWLSPTTTVLYITLNPITAMMLGIILLGEELTAQLVVGMALVLIGIFVGSGFAVRNGAALQSREPFRP